MSLVTYSKQSFFTSATQANPAAGAGATIFVPVSTQWLIKSLRFTLVTSATAGNRTVALAANDASSNLMVQVLSSYVQPASTSIAYNFARGLPATTSPVFFTITQPSCDVILGPMANLSIGVLGIQP